MTNPPRMKTLRKLRFIGKRGMLIMLRKIRKNPILLLGKNIPTVNEKTSSKNATRDFI